MCEDRLIAAEDEVSKREYMLSRAGPSDVAECVQARAEAHARLQRAIWTAEEHAYTGTRAKAPVVANLTRSDGLPSVGLYPGVFTLGGDPTCDVVLPELSAFHACLSTTGGECWVHDFQCAFQHASETFVEGVLVDNRTYLRHGDCISFGPTRGCTVRIDMTDHKRGATTAAATRGRVDQARVAKARVVRTRVNQAQVDRVRINQAQVDQTHIDQAQVDQPQVAKAQVARARAVRVRSAGLNSRGAISEDVTTSATGAVSEAENTGDVGDALSAVLSTAGTIKPACDSPAAGRASAKAAAQAEMYANTAGEGADQAIAKADEKSVTRSEPCGRRRMSSRAIWQTMYEALRLFQCCYNHVCVSRRVGNARTRRLGEWAHRQRLWYRAIRMGSLATFPKAQSPEAADRVAKLDALGFMWGLAARRDPRPSLLNGTATHACPRKRKATLESA